MHFQFVCVVFALIAFCSATQNEIACGEPPAIPFASVTNTHSTKKYAVGTIVAYKCETGYAIEGRSTIAQCILSADEAQAQWTTAPISCTEITCDEPPVIPFASIRNLQSSQKYILGATVAYECEPGYDIKGRSTIAHCILSADEAHGQWTKVFMSCTESVPSSSSAATTASSQFTTLSIALTTESPTLMPLGQTTVAYQILTGDSSNSTEREGCSCTFAPENRQHFHFQNISASEPGIKMRKGDTATFSCNDNAAMILFWENGLRMHGSANLTCESCRKWEDRDIPKCMELRGGEPFVTLNPKMKLVPGGIIKIGQNESLELQCSTRIINNLISFPEWESPQYHKPIYNILPVEEGGYQISASISINSFTAELSGQYKCKSKQCDYNNPSTTSLFLEMADITCPKLSASSKMDNLRFSNQQYIGSKATFRCRRPNVLIGSSVLECLSSGKWNDSQPSCEIADQCIIPDVKNGKAGRYEMSNSTVFRPEFVQFNIEDKINSGETITLLCNDGFIPVERSETTSEPTSNQQVTCENGHWSMSLECKSVLCNGEPPSIENGYPVVEKRTHMHVIYYRCYKPYERLQAGNVQCLYGTWVGKPLKCGYSSRCNINQLDHPGLIKPKGEFIPSGQTIEISCLEGYTVTNKDKLIQCNKGLWNVPNNPCTEEESEVQCPELDEKDIFIITYHNHRRVNSVAYYVCKDPTWKTSGSNVRYCTTNKEWSGIEPECRASDCQLDDLMMSLPKSVVPNENDITGESVHAGKELRLLCEAKNQILIGSKSARCTQVGTWEFGNPQCILGCHLSDRSPSSTLIINSVKDYYRFGETIQLSCPDGQELTEEVEKIMCMAGHWSDPLPECKNMES